MALGFRGIKFAAGNSQQSAQQGSHQSVVDEMRALRRALGDEIEIMVDLHWKYAPTEAITLIRALEPYRPYFAEAPCAPEDIDGQADVAANVNVPPSPAAKNGARFFQVTAASRASLCRASSSRRSRTPGFRNSWPSASTQPRKACASIPHATIGVGIFHAASLLGAASLADVPFHEHQHSMFDANLRFVGDADALRRWALRAACVARGSAVEPKAELWTHIVMWF